MIISMTAYNRPELLEQVMRSLDIASRQLDESVLVIAKIEPTDPDTEMKVVSAIRGGGGQRVFGYAAFNAERLGLQTNTKAALDAAWGFAAKLGEDFVLHLEDDLLIAPDGLKYAAWARDTYREDEDIRYVGLTCITAEDLPEESWTRVHRTGWFDCHVWGTWRDVWEHDLSPNWPHEWWDHWAAAVNDMEMHGGLQVIPCLSRSRSIGVFGEHCDETYHETHNPRLYAADVEVPDEPFFENGPCPPHELTGPRP